MGGKVADYEPGELELAIYRRLLEHPERWWTYGEVFYRTDKPESVVAVVARLAADGLASVDGADRFRLTESGIGSLTWLVQTGGRERGLIGTFLWEGGSAARQMYHSRHGRRSIVIRDEPEGFDDVAGGEFDYADDRGFWWTLRRFGLAEARMARRRRSANRRGFGSQ